MLQIVPRAVALERGLERYFNGKPCIRGHLMERQTIRKTCPACRRERERAKNATAEKKLARAEYDRMRWLHDNERIRAKNRRYYAANADTVNAQKREYWAANADRMKEANRVWREKNRHVVRQLSAERKRHIRVATPPWADRAAIRAVYAEAERLTVETGIQHHVDHVIPLRGKLVCGLHVHNNIRPLPSTDNIRKKNKFSPS